VIPPKEISLIRDFVNGFRNVRVERFVVNAPDAISIPLSSVRKPKDNEKQEKISTIRVYLPSLGYILEAERITNSVQVIDVFIKRRTKAS